MQKQYSAADSPLKDSAFLNLPHIRFYDWCYEQYGINQGVFNTIINYLEKILFVLKKLGYVESKRGVQGGYFLIKPPEDINIGDVIR